MMFIYILLSLIDFIIYIETNTIYRMVEREQYGEAKSKTLLWAIVGLLPIGIATALLFEAHWAWAIVGLLLGVGIVILLLIAYLKINSIIKTQMKQPLSNRMYPQPTQQTQYVQQDGQLYKQPQNPNQNPQFYQQSHSNSQVPEYTSSQPIRVSSQYVHNIYSANASEKEPPSFDFGDFSLYHILHKIGSGGFSDVYAVERNGRRYAMKIPKGVDLSGSDTLELKEKDLEGYGKEAEIWAMLTEREPKAVVNLVDAGIRPFPWFVMEIGERKLGDAVGTASPQEKLRIIAELLGKLDRIHHYAVVHKDIKPDNILFAGGNWKFTDFGLSKVLSMSSKSSAGFSGTMFYMAPEQVSKKHFGNTDWRTDIWQMGVLAYEMLTGHLPFDGDDPLEITTSILHDEPTPGTKYGMNKKVWNVVRKALEKRKEDRWQSAVEFKKAIEEAIR